MSRQVLTVIDQAIKFITSDRKGKTVNFTAIVFLSTSCGLGIPVKFKGGSEFVLRQEGESKTVVEQSGESKTVIEYKINYDLCKALGADGSDEFQGCVRELIEAIKKLSNKQSEADNEAE